MNEENEIERQSNIQNAGAVLSIEKLHTEHFFFIFSWYNMISKE